MQTLRPTTNALLAASNRISRNTYRPAYVLTSQCTHPQQRRTFIPAFFANSPQTLTASRTLNYPPSTIYAVISDVSSYSQFLPYCQRSLVTKQSGPAASTGQAYPEEARLSIGFTNGVSEEFWSRIYCIPERVVEAVSGETETAFSGDEVAHHNARPAAERDPTRNASVLSHLSTKWTIEPVQGRTEVKLAIEYQFANPMYAALSSAAAPMVADKMIEAFEQRVKAVAEGKS